MIVIALTFSRVWLKGRFRDGYITPEDLINSWLILCPKQGLVKIRRLHISVKYILPCGHILLFIEGQ